MRTKLLLLAAIIFSHIFHTPAFSAPTSPEAHTRRVGKVEIVVHERGGETQTNPKPVETQMLTRQGDVFIQRDFDKDIKALSERYENVDSKVYTKGGEVFIELNLYPKSIIRKILFEGNAEISDDKLQDTLKLKEGKPFETADFNNKFAELKKYYIKEGFFESSLDYEIRPVEDSNDIDLVIKINEGRSGKIRDLFFEGLTKNEESEVREKLLTKTYFFLTSWVTGKGNYDEAMVEQDKRTITDYLQDKGYADASVSAEIVPTEKDNRIEILFKIYKGNAYSFANVTFSGNTLFDNEKIEDLIDTEPGAAYSQERLHKITERINTAYGSKGYIDAYTSYDLTLIPDQKAYNVSLKISEGKPYKVGMVKIMGNTSTHNSVILHESVLIPGETFDIRRLKKTEERLMNVGYFQNVNVYAAKPREDHPLGKDFRDVYIEVEETGTGNLSLFFGYSTLDSIFGGAEIAEYNFNYKGLINVFSDGLNALRGGGEFFKFKFSIGRKYSTFDLGWSKPFFMDTPWEVGFNIERSISQLQSDDYEIRSLGLSIHASYPLSLFWRFGWNYTIRNSDVSVSGDAPEQLRRQADLDGLVSSTGISLNYDSTDRPYMPRNGFRSSISGTFAGLGGKVNFLQYGYNNTYYISPWEKLGTFKTRADLQFIQPTLGTTADTLPFDNRFFLGGETTVRGYHGFSIGPKFSNNDPKGGISSLLLSQEYLQNIFKNISAFVFIDAGSVSDRRFHIPKLSASYGAGLHIEVMPGVPIIVGMGFPINPPSNSDVQKAFISIGGRF